MTVKAILDSKGSDVTTLSSDQTLGFAVGLLYTQKIGALVVLNPGGAIAGILSERDIIRALATRKGDALKEPVSSFMTAKVKTCSYSSTINEVMEVMTSGRFRHMPVAEDGKLVGIISIGDVVKRRIEGVEREAAEIRNYIAAG